MALAGGGVMRVGLLWALTLGACGLDPATDKVVDSATVASSGEDCANGVDDDGDGAVDCADPECWALGACPEDCANGADDDGDGAVDCADDACDGQCPEDCADGRDNDGDGAIDCWDEDCAGSCPEDCGNGVDDDGDGWIDCLDEDCAEACPEDCVNGVDDDADGATDCDDPECATTCDADGDGYASDALGGDDCDDADAAVNPGAREVCGNGDDDCDGRVDEDDPDIDASELVFFYPDGDFDGWGAPVPPYPACVAPPGFVERSGDCDDTNNGIYPSQIERCNLQDDDCDGLVDDADDSIDPSTQVELYEDADGDGLGGELVLRCWPGAGFVDEGGDCDDLDPALSDPGDWWVDADGDGFGTGPIEGPTCEPPSAAHVLVVLGEDCRDDRPEISPGTPEVCDNVIDDDCDGVVDGVYGHDGVCLGCGAAAGLAHDPVLYWRMDVDGGWMSDAGSSSADGSVMGAPSLFAGLAADASWGLDGDDHVAAELWEEVPRDALTVSLWLRSTDRSAGLVHYASTGNTRDLVLELDDSGALNVAVVGFEHGFPVEIADGAWHHVVVTWASATGRVELYVDAVLEGSAELALGRRLTYAGTFAAGAGQSCISCFDQHLTGVLDEVAVFPSVLSADVVTDVYRGTTCDEGTVCNGADDDGDGLTDERLVGQTGCPAAGCAAVFESDAWYGPVVYDLLDGDAVCE